MKFEKCGHEANMGKKGWCIDCVNAGEPKKHAAKRKKSKAKKEAPKKRGRPKWKTEEEKAATKAAYIERTRESRREYLKHYARTRYGVDVGQYVVFVDGKWKNTRSIRDGGLGSFFGAKIYGTRKLAGLAVSRMGFGEVMERKETEEETLANHKAKTYAVNI